MTSYPEPGEVIWADRAGVACRRWNWRQGRRTLLTTDTRQAYVVLDRLAPYTEEAILAAGEKLTGLLRRQSWVRGAARPPWRDSWAAGPGYQQPLRLRRAPSVAPRDDA